MKSLSWRELRAKGLPAITEPTQVNGYTILPPGFVVVEELERAVTVQRERLTPTTWPPQRSDINQIRPGYNQKAVDDILRRVNRTEKKKGD